MKQNTVLYRGENGDEISSSFIDCQFCQMRDDSAHTIRI
jgi:hypothetical protein